MVSSEEPESQIPLRMLSRFACRDISRNRVHFCIAFWSVFLVAISILVVKTLISHGPLIFLKLAQSKLGDYDFVVLPLGTKYDDTDKMNSYVSKGQTINYQNLMKKFESSAEQHTLVAPRKQFCNTVIGSRHPEIRRTMFEKSGSKQIISDWIKINGTYHEPIPTREEVWKNPIGFLEKGCILLID